MQGTIKCPKCTGADSAIRWENTKEGTLVCLACGHKWIRGTEIAKNNGDFPLLVNSNMGTLSLFVSGDVLKFAAETHQGLWDGESGPDVPVVKITDQREFAFAVAEAINAEDEDGSTLLTRMLDEAIMQAVEDGCDGVDHE